MPTLSEVTWVHNDEWIQIVPMATIFCVVFGTHMSNFFIVKVKSLAFLLILIRMMVNKSIMLITKLRMVNKIWSHSPI